mmetsp:Transcript_8264/g.25533  ORF Transcript_8264/g.25533 Transcript_8264/m.25533 type:complete len:240 (-) Transcript_8264:433-1152(-)
MGATPQCAGSLRALAQVEQHGGLQAPLDELVLQLRHAARQQADGDVVQRHPAAVVTRGGVAHEGHPVLAVVRDDATQLPRCRATAENAKDLVDVQLLGHRQPHHLCDLLLGRARRLPREHHTQRVRRGANQAAGHALQPAAARPVGVAWLLVLVYAAQHLLQARRLAALTQLHRVSAQARRGHQVHVLHVLVLLAQQVLATGALALLAPHKLLQTQPKECINERVPCRVQRVEELQQHL